MPAPVFPRSKTLRTVRLAHEAAETRVRDGDFLSACTLYRRAAQACLDEHEAREVHLRGKQS